MVLVAHHAPFLLFRDRVDGQVQQITLFREHTRIAHEVCDLEREFFRCAGRGVAVRLKCNNDLVRSRNEAAFFAPMALGQPLSLEAAGAEH